MKKIFLFAISIILCSLSVYSNNDFVAREYFGEQASMIVPGAEHIWVKQDNIIPSFIKFRPERGFAEEVFFMHISKIFHLPANYSFKYLKTEKDKLGYEHKRYQLMVNNVPVFSGIFLLHIKDGKVESYNGYLFNQVNTTTTPSINETSALTHATNHIGASIYKWQMPIEEDFIKREQNNPEATFFPKGELIIIQKGNDNKSNEFRLCWKFDIYAHSPMSRHDVYVDAQTGEVIKETDKICHVDAAGTATTVYRGVRAITTDNTGTTYRLREAGRGNGIRTFNMLRGTTYGSAVDFTDADNNWNNVNPQLDQYAPDAHWAAEKTYDYFLTHGRSSIDGAGYLLNLYVHYDVNYVNAFWDGTRMTFGDGDATYDPLVSLDITGHEVTHGLTTNTSDLDYSYQSGALNESFSDIFGVAVEYYADIPGADWTIGEDIGGAFRSMSNPNAYGQPDTYLGTAWYTGTADNGGVHTNSGVQNYWYYLLINGGSGTNDVGDVYSVTGQGRTIASAIAWRNNVIYLTNTADFDDARFYAIQSANDLYGACTPQVIACTNAWYAVNVGNAFVAGVDAQFTNSNPVGCAVPFTVNFTNNSVNAGTYTWYFGDGATSTLANPTHVYTTLGVYTVKLVASGGSCGTDSITYTNLVNINPSNPCAVNIPASGAGPVQTTCTGTVYDNGGQFGAYTDNTDGSITISPPGASRVTLTFTRFRMENTYDFLRVYDGASIASPIIGSYTGFTLPAVINSTGGSITVRQESDPSVVDTGFAINWSCTSASTPPVASFIADITNTCNGKVKFSDRTTGAVTSWAWTFGDGGTSTLQNPTHVYTTNGTYTVTLTATNAFGSNTSTRTSYIVVNRPVGPTVVNGSRCGTGTVSLSATTTNNVNWYATATDTTKISIANPYTTPSIATTTTYYVEQAIPQTAYNVGPATNAFGTGGNFNGDRNWGLKFNVLKPCMLNSVYVYAQGSGFRTIQYRDTSGSVIASRNIFIPNGGSRINLNFDLTPGTWILGVQDSMNLYRNNSGASYPYNDAGGNVSIISTNLPTGTSGASGYYYYFYNWIVQGYDCLSRRVAVTATVNPLPTVNAGRDSTKCGGVTGVIRVGGSPTASGGSTPYTYAWSPATGLSSTSIANPNANPTATTNYALQVTDNRGCIGRDTVRIGIGSNPTANAGLDKNRCNGATAVAIGGSPTGTGTVAPYTYVWAPTTGLSSSTVANPNASPSATTTYNVKVIDAIGCFAYDTMRVTQRPNPTVNAGRDSGWCAGGTAVPVVLGGSPTASGGSTPYIYTWSPATSLSSSSVANPTTTTTTNKTYALSVTDLYNCVGRDTVLITINPLPNSAAGTDKTFCDGGTASGSIGGSPTGSGGTGPYSYLWSPSTGLSSTGTANPTLSGVITGSRTYAVRVTDAKGCVSYDTVLLNTTPSVTPVITITGNDTICTGQSTVLNATPTGIAYPLLWNTSATTPSITVTTGGTYTVSVPSCGTTSSSVVITELPSPIANFSQTIIGLTSTFTDLSTGSPTRWRWDFGDGSAFDNTPNPSHTYTSLGTYTVTLTVGNDICSNSFSKTISLNPNSINPILENDKLSIYPNPAKDLIYIQLNENIKTPIDIEITNTLGENVLSKKITQSISNNLYSLNIEHLSSGVYYIKTRDKNNKISIGKFVVDK
jgi:Zn-dependent metalloprotease